MTEITLTETLLITICHLTPLFKAIPKMIKLNSGSLKYFYILTTFLLPHENMQMLKALS